MHDRTMAEAQGGKDKSQAKLPPNQRHKQRPLSVLTREELEVRVRQLEAHNTQLRNLLTKSQAGGMADLSSIHTKQAKQREFDFTKHSHRHVALKLCYLGWNYQGFAVQEDSQNTIESQLFAALLKTRLIESRETSNYHRKGMKLKSLSLQEKVKVLARMDAGASMRAICAEFDIKSSSFYPFTERQTKGFTDSISWVTPNSSSNSCGRTDKGVSAFDQVISITLRSKLRKGIGMLDPSEANTPSTTERLREQEEEKMEEEGRKSIIFSY
ncbi:tRNA pseudouridine(38/39) synthase [Chionoecetes opilio]|uniref:tRNA pseudouridine(38/39) synthase n=1 Tax=Chionoecetes opilio TaxID=41210 RepID=A0A8J8WEJ8_CHIOP|nr:tRNA pseudouridine(38/39) synthase [Chionoecetes opilio]